MDRSSSDLANKNDYPVKVDVVQKAKVSCLCDPDCVLTQSGEAIRMFISVKVRDCLPEANLP